MEPDELAGAVESGGRTGQEVASQGSAWRRVAEKWARAQLVQEGGSRLLFTGCGTAGHVGEAVGRLLEERQVSICDACTPSLYPHGRQYDTAIFISRSGTTSETVAAAHASSNARRKVAIVGRPGTPLGDQVDEVFVVDPVPERAVVQTVFPTSVIAFFRLQLGDDISALADSYEHLAQDAQESGEAEAGGARAGQSLYELDWSRIVFLGEGWASALAHEAALKLQELTLGWAESYVAPEYRHGPISGVGADTLVWQVGRVEARLMAEIRGFGATILGGEMDPMVELAGIYRWAVARAVALGLDPDAPRHLQKSVIL